MTDWAEEKAAILAPSGMVLSDIIDAVRTDIAAALREAEARGIRRAADLFDQDFDQGRRVRDAILGLLSPLPPKSGMVERSCLTCANFNDDNACWYQGQCNSDDAGWPKWVPKTGGDFV